MFSLNLKRRETSEQEEIINNPPNSPDRLTPQQTRKAQWLMFHEGGLWAVMNAISASSGVVMTAFALYLKADAFVIGLLGSLPLLAALAQLWTPQLVVFFGTRKTISILTLGGARLLLFPLTLIAVASWLIPAQHFIWLVLFLLILTLFSGLTAIGGTAWQSWAGTAVPIQQRAKYFANRQTYLSAIGLAITFLAGIFLDWWKIPADDGKSSAHPIAYVLLFLFAAIFGVITIFLLRKTPDLPRQDAKGTPRPRLLHTLKATWEHAPLRKYLLFRGLSLFAVSMVIPYYNVYLLQNLKLSFTEVSILQNAGALASLLSLPLWGRIIDRFGNSRVLFWTSVGKIIYVTAWAFIVPGNSFLPLLILHITLIMDAGQVLSTTNLLMNLMPRQDAGNIGYFSVFTATTSVFSAAGPFLAGIIIGLMGTQQFPILGIGMGAIQLMFIVSAVLRLVSLSLFKGFSDKPAT